MVKDIVDGSEIWRINLGWQTQTKNWDIFHTVDGSEIRLTTWDGAKTV